MDNITIFLSAMMIAAIIVLFAPNIFARNRGKILRNIALWLAIFTALGLVYKNFGPDSKHPLFSGPASVVQHEPDEPKSGAATEKKPDDDKTDGSKGFTPPSE